MSNEIAQSPTKETRPQGTRQSWQRPRYEVKPGKDVYELRVHDFRLQLQLNVKIDTDQISARSEAGVLTVSLPVAEESKPRTIAVE